MNAEEKVVGPIARLLFAMGADWLKAAPDDAEAVRRRIILRTAEEQMAMHGFLPRPSSEGGFS